ncbi:hypothetical protein GCM10007423_01510 [Dyadobacter endophyticus]|uniref:KTSC domain-containing protein n=1 Tax=Dyadobacter endophyticus TaxID=1749036 RepID=A0ABQ1YDX0_9BACT|nr:hypothetical protein GCM10007423_01510 [Dyadobacter endophyticus]
MLKVWLSVRLTSPHLQLEGFGINDDRDLIRRYTKAGQNNYLLYDYEARKLYEFVHEANHQPDEPYMFANAVTVYRLRYPRNGDR